MEILLCFHNYEQSKALSRNPHIHCISEGIVRNSQQVKAFDVHFGQYIHPMGSGRPTLAASEYTILQNNTHVHNQIIISAIKKSILIFRDEAQAKMILLKEKADKDLQQHNAEMKEHVRIIDHDKKLRDFMNTKCKERQEDPQLVAWRQRKGKRYQLIST